MSVVFLIGGTGNQLFSFVASKESDRFSKLFLTAPIRRLLGWNHVEQVINYESASVIEQCIALFVLGVDTLLLKLFGKTLFSALDTRRLKSSPIICEFVRLGYFQSAAERRNLNDLATQISPEKAEGQIVLHIRGGDLLALEKEGRNVYGMLDKKYFLEGIGVALSEFSDDNRSCTSVLVLTDDPDYARTFKLDEEGLPAVEIRNCSLKDTLSLAVGASWFVSSRSTLSYWIVRLRAGNQCVAPIPFHLSRDFQVPASCVRLGTDKARC